MPVFDFSRQDPGAPISDLAETLTAQFGPQARIKRRLTGELERGGRLSPLALQLLLGGDISGAAATAGIDPFSAIDLSSVLGGAGGAAPLRQVPPSRGPTILPGQQPPIQGAPFPEAPPEGGDLGTLLGPQGPGGPEVSPTGFGPEMFAGGFPPEVLEEITGRPSPREREERVLAQESVRDQISQLNLHHLRINRFLELMGRSERLPIYDPERFQVPFKGGGVQRKLQLRRLRTRMNDFIQSARTAREAMETQFAVGAETIPPVVTPEFLNYLRVFPNTVEELASEVLEGPVGEPR